MESADGTISLVSGYLSKELDGGRKTESSSVSGPGHPKWSVLGFLITQHHQRASGFLAGKTLATEQGSVYRVFIRPTR